MFKPIKSILFATNLSKNCQQAFEMAASIAISQEATLVLLHVIERMPDFIESRMRGMLGDKEYDALAKKHSDSARQAIIGKQSANGLIREALAHYCISAGMDDDDSCEGQTREIVVTEGEVVHEIIAQAKAYHCDIIVMGTREGFLSDNAIGHNIKAVMRQSRIPVMMVPSVHS